MQVGLMDYSDDSKPLNYSGKGKSNLPKIRENYQSIINADETKFKEIPKMEATKTEVVILEFGQDYYINELKKKETVIAEKDKLIQRLMTELDEFEMIRSFEFKNLDLPSDYYDN